MQLEPITDVRSLARAYKALGDETRLRILTLLLAVDELCVCRFEEALGIGQSKASRHLRYLLNAGLLEDRREGVWVHYRVARNLPADLAAVVDSVRRAVGDDEFRRIREELGERARAEDDAEAECGGAC